MGRVYGSQLGNHFDRMEPIRQQPPFKHGPRFFKQEVSIFSKTQSLHFWYKAFFEINKNSRRSQFTPIIRGR